VRPLGYWIKEIDRRLEAGLDRLLADEGLTRRHWQVLATLGQRAAGTLAELDAALAVFAPTVRPQLDDLVHRGWVTGAGGGVALTAEGWTAHERVAERVRAFRAQVTDDLSEQEYVTLVTLLERVAGCLTPARPAR
jgi:DNA-binding MarR family transcriptional regulator